jgi:hypothetical protein
LFFATDYRLLRFGFSEEVARQSLQKPIVGQKICCQALKISVREFS